jgi:hypothetical protein
MNEAVLLSRSICGWNNHRPVINTKSDRKRCNRCYAAACYTMKTSLSKLGLGMSVATGLNCSKKKQRG